MREIVPTSARLWLLKRLALTVLIGLLWLSAVLLGATLDIPNPAVDELVYMTIVIGGIIAVTVAVERIWRN